MPGAPEKSLPVDLNYITVAIQDLAGICGQQSQRPELIGRQINGSAVQQGNLFGRINGQTVKRADRGSPA
jgi:hypothetical protein